MMPNPPGSCLIQRMDLSDERVDRAEHPGPYSIWLWEALHNRKNWLFAGHPNGAHAAAAIYSLIETAKAHRHEPYKYLRLLLDRLPYAKSPDDYIALLPGPLTSQ
jgi:hypothetical protein